jgi:hypothetical protein
VDAWETLLTQSKADDARPCYHLVEKYSTDVLERSQAASALLLLSLVLHCFPNHSHQHADHKLDLTDMVFGAMHRDNCSDKAEKLPEVACGHSAIHCMNSVVSLSIGNTAKVALSAQVIGIQRYGDSLPSAYFACPYIARGHVSN